MSASLVGSEMCIRDSPCPRPEAPARRVERVVDADGEPERTRVDEDGGASPGPGCKPAPDGGRGRVPNASARK
eukprot:6800471-Alexandrium_andersonii.AAC.1